jgi:hypothetical protein
MRVFKVDFSYRTIPNCPITKPNFAIELIEKTLMNFITAYIKGLKTSFQKGKLWLLLYALNFIFALFLAYPLSGFLEGKLGKTMAIEQLAKGFDFTVFNDLFNESGELIGFILNQSLVVLGLYTLLSVFLVGGILAVFKNRETVSYIAQFWSGAANYFWRMLRLTIYFLLFQIGLFILFFTLFSFLTAGGLERFHNEAQIVQRGLIILPFYLFLATTMFMIQDYAKIHVVATERKLLFQPILQAFRWVFKNFFQVFSLYLLNLITFGLLFFIYWNLNTGSNILWIFLIGQIFIFTRIGTKLLNLASATIFYQEHG